MKAGRVFQVVMGAFLVMALGSSAVMAEEFKYVDQFLLKTGGPTVESRYSDVATVVNTVVQPVFIIAGIIFFATIVINGARMAISPGNKQTLESAKKYITYSLVGFVIVFCAFWIVQLVGIITGIDVPLK